MYIYIHLSRDLHEYEQLRDCVSPDLDGDVNASVLSGREGRRINMDETGDKTEVKQIFFLLR